MGSAALAPSAISCSLFPLISRIYSCLFSDWKHTVSLKFFDTQVLSIFTEELVLPCHSRCVVPRLRCNGHNLLLSSYLSRIGRILPAAPAETVVVVVYPTPSEGWGHGGRPWSPRSRATPQRLDQRS